MQDTLAVIGMVVGLVTGALLNGAIIWDLRRWCKNEHNDGMDS